jgi:ubiquitin C-terminal hydrolase
LNEARENLEQMIDEMHDSSEGEKPRTYRKKARNDYLKTARKKVRIGKKACRWGGAYVQISE